MRNTRPTTTPLYCRESLMMTYLHITSVADRQTDRRSEELRSVACLVDVSYNQSFAIYQWRNYCHASFLRAQEQRDDENTYLK